MNSSGRLVILLMLGVAVIASAFAWGFRHRQSQRVLNLWSGEAASNIRRAEKVTMLDLKLCSEGETPEITLQGANYRAIKELDLTKTPGIIHARAALISDASFDWDREISTPVWEFALRFSSGESSSTVVFNLDAAAAAQVKNGIQVGLGEKFTKGLKTYLAEVRGT